MSRAQGYRWDGEVHNAVRKAVGDGLKQQLEAPQELPADIASLVAQIEGMTASVSTDKVAYASLHLSTFEDRLQGFKASADDPASDERPHTLDTIRCTACQAIHLVGSDDRGL